MTRRDRFPTKAWAEKHYGKRQWVCDQFGGRHDVRVVLLVWQKVDAA